MKVFIAKLKVIPLMLLVPVASIFEVTDETYLKKVSKNYKYLIDTLKM